MAEIQKVDVAATGILTKRFKGSPCQSTVVDGERSDLFKFGHVEQFGFKGARKKCHMKAGKRQSFGPSLQILECAASHHRCLPVLCKRRHVRHPLLLIGVGVVFGVVINVLLQFLSIFLREDVFVHQTAQLAKCLHRRLIQQSRQLIEHHQRLDWGHVRHGDFAQFIQHSLLFWRDVLTTAEQ